MYIIGLTGGSGSGKTTVSNYLRKKGFEIIDFDLTTRELQKPGEPALAEIVEAFGPESLLPDGTMNRKYVGKVVFSDPKEKKKMDSIIQKYVDVLITARTDAFREAGRDVTRQTNPTDYLQKKVIFYDHPLLFEVPYNIEPANEAWVVDVDDETRIQRILKRDCICRDDIIKRMNSQTSRQYKLERADYVIDNSGTKEELFRNVDAQIEALDRRLP